MACPSPHAWLNRPYTVTGTKTDPWLAKSPAGGNIAWNIDMVPVRCPTWHLIHSFRCSFLILSSQQGIEGKCQRRFVSQVQGGLVSVIHKSATKEEKRMTNFHKQTLVISLCGRFSTSWADDKPWLGGWLWNPNSPKLYSLHDDSLSPDHWNAASFVVLGMPMTILLNIAGSAKLRARLRVVMRTLQCVS